MKLVKKNNRPNLIYVLCILLLQAFCTCSNEQETARNPIKDGIVTLKLQVNGIYEQSPKAETAIRDEYQYTKSIIDPINKDFILETQIGTINESHQRAGSSTQLNPDAIIIAIVYKKNGELYKYHTFPVKAAVLYLPENEAFSVLFYSYNSVITPQLSFTDNTTPGAYNDHFFTPGTTLNSITEDNGKNVMYSYLENTGKITTSTRLPSIRFTPVFNRMQWILSYHDNREFGISSASVGETFNSALVKIDLMNKTNSLTDIWEGTGTADKQTPLLFPSPSATSQISEKTIFINGGEKTSLNGNIGTMSFNTTLDTLKRGTSYTVKSKLVPANSTFRIEIRADKNGSVTPDGVIEGRLGDEIISIATPANGYTHEGWFDGETPITESTGDIGISDTWIKIILTTATNNKTFTAKFKPANLVINPGPGDWEEGGVTEAE